METGVKATRVVRIAIKTATTTITTMEATILTNPVIMSTTLSTTTRTSKTKVNNTSEEPRVSITCPPVIQTTITEGHLRIGRWIEDLLSIVQAWQQRV